MSGDHDRAPLRDRRRSPETPVASGTGELARRAAVQTGTALLVVALVLLAWKARQVLLLLFAAGLLGIALQSTATFLSRRARLRYGVALALTTVMLLGGLAALGWAIGPRLAEQTGELQRDLPRALDALTSQLERTRLGREAVEGTEQLQRWAVGLDRADLWRRLAGVFSTVVGSVGAALVVLVVGIYLAAEPRKYVGAVVRLFPPPRRGRIQEVVEHALDVLRWWLLGRFLTMVFVGVVVWAGLTALGVPLALTLGVLAGLLDFVPNVGPLLAAAPAILLALVASPGQALWVAALYTGVQLVEAYFVSPLVERRTVSLPPVAVIAAQLVSVVLFGALGAVLATPIAAVVLVLVRDLYLEDTLEEKHGGSS